MKRLIQVVFLAAMLSGASSPAGEKTYQIDPVHSSVQFRIQHLYSTFVGRFDRFEGTISGDTEKPDTLKVSASVDVTSIDTANADREKHLRSPDFFDTDKNPVATFVSTGTVLAKKENSGSVTGKLTIRGITKEVTFTGQFLGHGADPKGVSHAGFHASSTINRVDYGVAFASSPMNGITLLGSDVELILDLDAVEVVASPVAKPVIPVGTTEIKKDSGKTEPVSK